MVAVPAMSADIVLGIDFSTIDSTLYFLYFWSEIFVYLLGFLTAKLLFREA